jgi:hypothetical protein
VRLNSATFSVGSKTNKRKQIEIWHLCSNCTFEVWTQIVFVFLKFRSWSLPLVVVY